MPFRLEGAGQAGAWVNLLPEQLPLLERRASGVWGATAERMMRTAHALHPALRVNAQLCRRLPGRAAWRRLLLPALASAGAINAAAGWARDPAPPGVMTSALSYHPRRCSDGSRVALPRCHFAMWECIWGWPACVRRTSQKLKKLACNMMRGNQMRGVQSQAGVHLSGLSDEMCIMQECTKLCLGANAYTELPQRCAPPGTVRTQAVFLADASPHVLCPPRVTSAAFLSCADRNAADASDRAAAPHASRGPQGCGREPHRSSARAAASWTSSLQGYHAGKRGCQDPFSRPGPQRAGTRQARLSKRKQTHLASSCTTTALLPPNSQATVVTDQAARPAPANIPAGLRRAGGRATGGAVGRSRVGGECRVEPAAANGH